MSKTIVTQILGVSHRRDAHRSEGLVYSPAPLTLDGPAPEPICQPINAEVLNRQLDDVRKRVEELLWRARLQKQRDGIGIEREAEELASHILPKNGFVRVVEPGVHPQFDIVFDAASQIPWEILEERYAFCDCDSSTLTVRPRGDLRPQIHCQFCGKPMKNGGGKLVMDRHLTHLVRGGQAPTTGGTEFLVIEDPTDNLCTAQFDPDGVCAAHFRELATLLARHGYDVNVIKTQNATVRRVMSCLGNPSVVGLYYFGHGFFSREADQGCLLLADGALYASEIEELNPTIRFAFLNACEGAEAGRNWVLERKFRSVGHSFARGGPMKVVLAPLWPVLNFQAATTALDFFRAAFDGKQLGVALHEARRNSLHRYEQGTPDISWMAYRYFGDPGRSMPVPKPSSTTLSAGGGARTCERVFDKDGKLDSDLFAFDIADALLRAAKRRNQQGRSLATAADFFAGLVRTGELTRFLFREHDLEPDRVYADLCAEPEIGPTSMPNASGDQEDSASESSRDQDSSRRRLARLRQMLARWVIRKKEELHEDLITVFNRADECAQRRSSGMDRRILERDVLDAMTLGDKWPGSVKTTLPPANSVRQWLGALEQRQLVDGNGRLVLTALSRRARGIVEAAHVLAQQRGALPIPNRLLLAAFLIDPKSHGAEYCRRQGSDGKLLASALIAATEGKSPKSFTLGHESSAHVVLPMLVRAREMQRELKEPEISEAILFRAYCEVAPPNLKLLLKSLPAPANVDLDTNQTELSAGAKHWESRSGPTIGPDEFPSLLSASTSGPSIGQSTSVSAWSNGTLSHVRVEHERGQWDESVQQLIVAAAQFGVMQGHLEVRSPHLFVALLTEGSGTLAEVLRQRGVRPERLVTRILALVPPQSLTTVPEPKVVLSRTVQNALAGAAKYASAAGREWVSEGDILRALLADRDEIVPKTLIALGLEWVLDVSLE